LQVLDVTKNALDEPVQWKVRWYAPTDRARNEKSSFHYLSGPQFVEVLDVDPEMLVASATKLVGNNKKLPAPTIKDATKALRTAVLAEVNGELSCNACHKDVPGEQLLACGCCGRSYHEQCAPNFGNSRNAEWWCPTCSTNTGEAD
jgi:hypothetical protein